MPKMPETTNPNPTTKNPAAVALGRLGGGANTTAQHRARQQNARRGGRPGRICVYCGEPVRGGHVDVKLDDRCGQHGWRWQQGHTDTIRPSGATALLEQVAVLARKRSVDPTERLLAINDLLKTAGI